MAAEHRKRAVLRYGECQAQADAQNVPSLNTAQEYKRVSYSGYYAAFPRPRGEFDSLYPHHYRPFYEQTEAYLLRGTHLRRNPGASRYHPQFPADPKANHLQLGLIKLWPSARQTVQ